MDVAAPQALEQQTVRLEFTARGTGYFGIWIVNLLLSVLTLGVYSAWAKVRRLQYFYRNTSLAGVAFAYHGQPLAILRGRVIAVVLLVAYRAALHFGESLGMAVLAVLGLVTPWLLLRSLRFRLHNSGYRGLRFSFRGGLGASYAVFLLLPLATFATAFLLGPLWHRQIKRYQHGNAWYGQTRFGFGGSLRAFYGVWLVAAGLFFGALVLIIAAGLLLAPSLAHVIPRGTDGRTLAALIVLTVLAVMGLLALCIGPYVTARLQNLIWNDTTLGPHRFVSTVSARRLLYITVTNLVGMVATLGLFRPFAVVRTLRYRLESVALLPNGELDDFVADQTPPPGASGEEAADLFDVDIAL